MNRFMQVSLVFIVCSMVVWADWLNGSQVGGIQRWQVVMLLCIFTCLCVVMVCMNIVLSSMKLNAVLRARNEMPDEQFTESYWYRYGYLLEKMDEEE